MLDQKQLQNWKRTLEADIISRAWKDDAFRGELVHDPKAVLERELGNPVPEHVHIHIHEETLDTYHFVLPSNPLLYGDISEWESRQQPRETLEALIIFKAQKDDAFRGELVRDPKVVLERELGNPVPEHVHIHIHEETLDTYHFVLPSNPLLQVRELPDTELMVSIVACWPGSDPPPPPTPDTCDNYCGTNIGFTCPADECTVCIPDSCGDSVIPA